METSRPQDVRESGIQLLLVDDDVGAAQRIARILEGCDRPRFEVTHVTRIEDALGLVRSGTWQMLLIGVDAADGRAIAGVADLKAAAGGAPIVVMMDGDGSEAAGLRRAGASDQLPRREPSPRLLLGTLRHAVERDRMLTDLTLARKREQYIATHDDLTDLPNRPAFLDQFERAVAYASRNDTQLALLILDLDRFKTINESLGHPVGDELLKILADRLRRIVRRSDMLARFGGDEFIVMLQNVRRDHDPARVAEKILRLVSQPCVLAGREYRVTASIGISMFPADGTDANMLVRAADMALYHAKDRGRDGFSYYADEMNAVVARALEIDNGLRAAVESESFAVLYQPQVHVGFRTLVGAEALLRWCHPIEGQLPPGDFIAMAEETGIITEIGSWVLRNACADAASWQHQGGEQFRLAVNVSARQLSDEGFIDLVARTLEETGLTPDRLELEITESSALERSRANVEMIRRVREFGVRVLLDDLGTGYSSLNALRQIPVDGIKIDRTFVADITTDPVVATITSGLIAIANGLGIEVTAEGVETWEQMAFLHSRGCHRMQGYLFSKPLGADEFAQQVASGEVPWERGLPEFGPA
jgi:diguanylate cyclase (GGDEF)-like protein